MSKIKTLCKYYGYKAEGMDKAECIDALTSIHARHIKRQERLASGMYLPADELAAIADGGLDDCAREIAILTRLKTYWPE